MKFPFEISFIEEEEFMGYTTRPIQKVVSSDGHSFTIMAIDDEGMSDRIILAYDEDQKVQVNDAVWTSIQLGPRKGFGTTDVVFNGEIRPLIVTNRKNENHNQIVYNDGYMMVLVGYDGQAINELCFAVSSLTHHQFFNTLALGIIEAITNHDKNEEI